MKFWSITLIYCHQPEKCQRREWVKYCKQTAPCFMTCEKDALSKVVFIRLHGFASSMAILCIKDFISAYELCNKTPTMKGLHLF